MTGIRARDDIAGVSPILTTTDRLTVAAVGGNAAPNTFGVANLESPADDILHLVVAAYAFYAAWRPQVSMTT